jgi:hypothetical protein
MRHFLETESKRLRSGSVAPVPLEFDTTPNDRNHQATLLDGASTFI